MKLHLRLFASACILLLLPMTANAIVITYTSNDLGGGIYLTADIDISAAAPGLYSEGNGGLTSFTLSAFDGSGLLDTASAPPSTLYDNFVFVAAGGQIEEWFLYASITAGGALFTINDTGAFTGFRPQRVDYVNGTSAFASLSNAPGGWSDVPEPGTLALLAAGVGFMYRRKTIGGRV